MEFNSGFKGLNTELPDAVATLYTYVTMVSAHQLSWKILRGFIQSLSKVWTSTLI